MENIKTGFTSQWIRTNVNIMESKEIGFVPPPRPWQAKCFEIIAPNNPIALINAPTGSGKSTMLSMLAYKRTVSDFSKKTIIAVPQVVIGKGFNTKVFKLPNGEIIDWSVGVDLCKNAKDTVEQFISFIKEDIFYSKAYPFGRILVCTHATLVAAFQSLSQEEKEKYWKNLLICIDETHHLQMHEIADKVYNMNSLGQMLDYSFKNKNEIILVSATMFRGDQKGLVSDELLENAVKYNLPFDKYMEEMKHLKSFSYDFVVDTNEYTKDISKSINNLFSDGYKKLFIYIPHPKSYMSSGNKIQEIQDILEQIKINLNGDKITLNEKTGIYHITNALGLDYKVCDLVDEALSKRTIKFVNNEIINKDKNALDCVIALNRAKEGFDWEYADGMIVVGQRNSLTDVIQMVGRLLRDKQGKEKVKALHMLPFSPNQPTAPNLDNSLNDFFKAIAISLLMEDVFAPSSIQTNDDSAPTGQLSGNSSSSISSNIFDDLELDENQRLDLFDKAQKSLVNIAGGLVESQGTYSPEELKEQMPSIIKQWVEENNIEADEDQIEQLAKKVYNQFAKRTLQMQGINVSNINWQMIESADPIEFTLRYVGKDTTLESLKELRKLIAFGESESNRKTHIVCKRIEKYGYPELNFVDEEGINHYNFIHGKKQAKQGKGELAWYDSDQKIAESYKFSDLFDLIDELQKNLDNTLYCIEYHEINGKYPTRYSGTTENRKKGEWLVRHRSISKRSQYFNDCLELAKSKGHSKMFEWGDRKEEAINKLLDLFNWVKEYGAPRKNSSGIEKTYYSLIRTLVKSKNGKSDNVWYPGFDELFDEHNMWHLIISLNEKRVDQCKNFISFVEINKRAPTSANGEENLYNYWKKIILLDKCTPEEMNLIKKSDILKYCKTANQIRIENWAKNLKTLSDYFNQYKKLPSAKTHSNELNTLSEIKRRYDKKELDQELIDLANELNFLEHLNFIDKENEAKIKFIDLLNYLKTYNKRPSSSSSNEEEKKLGSYMSTLLKGFKGQRGFTPYPFYSELIQKENLSHFFEGLI